MDLYLLDRWTGNGPAGKPTGQPKGVRLTIRRAGWERRKE